MREVHVVTVVAEPLERTAWEPFGWLPVADTDPADGRRMLEFEWGDAHVNFISHAPTEIERTPRGARCDRMYRHDTHTQTLMPLNCESVLAVAPAGVDFAARDDASTIRAFRLRPLDCFVLARGTWHWGPFPLGDEPLRLWNLQGRRYAEDNASVDLVALLGTPVAVVG